jgi:hypothetical protein
LTSVNSYNIIPQLIPENYFVRVFLTHVNNYDLPGW